MDDSFIERWNKNIAADFDKALEVIRDKKLARAKPKTGYVPLEMYQEMVAGEKDMRRKIQDMYNELRKELAAKKDYIRHLEEEIEKCHAPVSDIADRGFEKIVPDTKWLDQDDYYLLHSLRESNRRFRNRKS